ncbi:MAG: hypothetical protein L0220_04315, partial [Acidobacteria bacterium]|nr:hypothetical protein [Acidobacteriota bacterium]
QHLESCANCRRIAEEFEESRDWLRGFPAPEFDEAKLDGMRDSVLLEIGRVERRPRRLEWIVPIWGPRFAFAASLALLLLIALFGLVISRRQLSHDLKSEQAEVKHGSGDQVGFPPTKKRGEQANKDLYNANRKPDLRRSRSKPIRPLLNKLPQEARNVGPDLSAQNIDAAKPFTGQSARREPANTDLAANRDMLRIEIQTADPNIRIIWFATKSDTAPISRP